MNDDTKDRWFTLIAAIVVSIVLGLLAVCSVANGREPVVAQVPKALPYTNAAAYGDGVHIVLAISPVGNQEDYRTDGIRRTAFYEIHISAELADGWRVRGGALDATFSHIANYAQEPDWEWSDLHLVHVSPDLGQDEPSDYRKFFINNFPRNGSLRLHFVLTPRLTSSLVADAIRLINSDPKAFVVREVRE